MISPGKDSFINSPSQNIELDPYLVKNTGPYNSNRGNSHGLCKGSRLGGLYLDLSGRWSYVRHHVNRKEKVDIEDKTNLIEM